MDRDAERAEAIEHGDPDVQFYDLAVEVSCHQRLELGTPNYGRFRMDNMRQWQLIENYNHCRWDEERVSCTWTQ